MVFSKYGIFLFSQHPLRLQVSEKFLEQILRYKVAQFLERICAYWPCALKRRLFEKFQAYSGFLCFLKVSKNITFASNQKTEQIFHFSYTIMAYNRQIEKVTYDLGCQGFSLLGEVWQGFPNEPMELEGRGVKLKFSGERSPKFWWRNFSVQKDGVLRYVLHISPKNFLLCCFTIFIVLHLCVCVCSVNTTYILIMLFGLNDFHYFSN